MTSKKIFFVTAGLALVAVLAGCSDHGDPLTTTIPGGNNDPVSLSADVQPLLDANCVACHGVGGNAGLDLRPGVSYGNLVGVAANNGGGNLVVAGDKMSSVLYQRMTGSQGGVMPPGGALSTTAQDLVGQWIDDGALDN